MNAAPEARNVDLLVVDDDVDLRREIADYLSSHDYTVHEAGAVPEMQRRLEITPIQLIILDVMLPGEDGLSACRRLTDQGAPPILMLSAMGEDVDRILGLELGADDYLTKPVNPRELLARVRALLRRKAAGPGAGHRAGYAFAGFRLDLTRRQVLAPDGAALMLTPSEFSLLGAFLEHPRQVLSRDQLLEYARGEEADVFDRAIDVQVSRLRRKLHRQTEEQIITTHRGSGYRFDARVTAI
jgi:two-component system OmpR family response regulator